MMSLPREVLLDKMALIGRERMTHLAPVCRYLYLHLFGELFTQTLNLLFIRLIRYLDTIGIYGI